MNSSFELRHLRYFVAVAEEKNMTRAANRLYLTQPALSRQIKDLEKLLDVELFVRTANGLALSPAGQEFLPQARQILDMSAGTMLSMRRYAASRQQNFAIGYIAPALGSFLSNGLQVFSQRHDQIAIKLYEMSPGRQVEALREGRLDVALVGHTCPDLIRDCKVEVIRRMPLVAVLHATHPLAQQATLALDALREEGFIGLDEETFPNRNEVIRTACAGAGFEPHIEHEADGLSTVLALVGNGAGVALVPDEVEQLPHPNTVFKPLQKPYYIEFCAALRNDEMRAPIYALLEEFRSVAGYTLDPKSALR